MEKYMCIDRVRKNNKIVSYKLQNIVTNQVTSVVPETLKHYIKNNKVEVLNLKLTIDNKLIMDNQKFQDKVDRNNKKYENNKVVQVNIEEEVDSIMIDIINTISRFSDNNKVLKFSNLITNGDTNSFQILAKTSLESDSDTFIVVRYRKNIEKINKDNYKFNIVLAIIGIKNDSNSIKFSNIKEYETNIFTYNTSLNKLVDVQNSNLVEESKNILKYFTNALISECRQQKIKESNLLNIENKIKRTGIQSVAAILILASCLSLTGCNTSTDTCSSNNSVQTVSTDSSSYVEETNFKKYKCDYKVLSLGTKIVTDIDGEKVTIKGNIFTFVTDPLTMMDSNDNVLAYASDDYHFITQDDHSILVDNKVEVVMAGKFDMFGQSYDIYNTDGVVVATLKTDPILESSAELLDTDGNLIAKYSRNIITGNYSVMISEDSEISDKAILMIMASVTSDVIADKSSSSSSSSSSN